MNIKLVIILTAFITWILTLIIFNGLYQGQNAKYWHDLSQEDWNAISCVKSSIYVNFPNLGYYYTNTLDSTYTYYSKERIDSCLGGL